MSAPRVTVVVPTYRRPDYLAIALNSVAAQSFREFRVIVTDDCGDPANAAVVEELSDPRFEHHRQPRNVGPAANNFSAFRRVETPLIAHLDDDDAWHPTMLETLITALDGHPRAVVAFGRPRIVDGQGRPERALTAKAERRWRRARLAEGEHPIGDLAVVSRSIPIACAAVFEKAALGRLADPPPAAGTAWDLWTSYHLARSGGTCVFVDETLADYRVHDDQLTGAQPALRTYSGTAHTLTTALADTAVDVRRAALRARLAHLRTYESVALLREGRVDDARRSADQAWGLKRDLVTGSGVLLSRTPGSVARRAASEASGLKYALVGRRG